MKSDTTPQLIDQLEDIASNTMLPLERRLVDTALWYHRNLPRIGEQDVPRKVEFMTKTLDIVLELLAMTAQRLQAAEGRKSEKLWLPNATQPISFRNGR